MGGPLELQQEAAERKSGVRKAKPTSDIFPSHFALGEDRCDVARCPLFSPGAPERRVLGFRNEIRVWGVEIYR